MPEYGSSGNYTVVMAGPFAGVGGGTGKLTTINAPVANWKGGTSPYSQVVVMDDISVNSKIDIQLNVNQIELFRGQDIAFTVENRAGEVTLVAVGDKPSADCVFQATVSDMLIVADGGTSVICGNTVKTASFNKTGGKMENDININKQKLNGLNDPEEDDQAANKAYVDKTRSIEQGGTGAENPKDARNNLGAAPDGYGLGGNVALKNWADVDSVRLPGWYRFNGAVSVDGITAYSPIMRVDGADNSHVVQTIFPHGNDNYRIVRKCSDNAWGSWEWENPPLNNGVEYRTTERYGDYIVYAKYVHFGEITGNATKTVAFSSATNAQGIRVTAKASRNATHITLPVTATPSEFASLYLSGRAVAITTQGDDWNGYTVGVVVHYIKV